MLENLTYFLNGASLSFFAMGAFHMAIYARQSKSRPHYLFTICLIWMALIELKEFFLSHDAAYNYEILGPGFTFPDLFTLALLSLFFFELVMPGRITARYSLKLLSPFVLLGGAYWLGTAFEPRTVYASLPELLKDLPSFLPTVILLYTLYTVGYCLFALTRIVLYSIRYSREIAQAYSFTERIHLQWLRWMSALLAFYLLSYIIIILFFSNIWFTILIYILTLTVWGILYGCILQYRIPDIIRDYWQPLPEEEPIEENPEINLAEGKGRAASLREQLQEAIVQRKLYLNPGLTIIDLACECGTNRTQLSLLSTRNWACRSATTSTTAAFNMPPCRCSKTRRPAIKSKKWPCYPDSGARRLSTAPSPKKKAWPRNNGRSPLENPGQGGGKTTVYGK